MSNESIERFDYDETVIGNIGPCVDGEYVRYSDHQRIVKELEAQWKEHEAAMLKSMAAQGRWIERLRSTPSISDAIKEVERTRDRYRTAGESSGLPNDMTASRDIHTANVLDRLVVRLNSLGTKGSE